MPPVDFCNRYDPRTHLRSSQTSIFLARTNPPRSSDPLSPYEHGPANRARCGEGRPSLLSSGVAVYATPDGNDRSLRRIYPNLMDPGTSCR
jgi:hypothetical protein